MKKQFKAGDIARVKYNPNFKVFILEVQEQTCYANVIQVWYVVRQFGSGRYGTIAKDIIRMSAIELEPCPSINKELKKLVTDFKRIKQEKEEYIKNQNFDKASALRGKENEIKAELEAKAEKEGLSLNEVLSE